MPSSLLSPCVSASPWGWRQLCLKCHGPIEVPACYQSPTSHECHHCFPNEVVFWWGEAPILVPGPGRIQRLSQGHKEESLLKDLSFEAFTWHLSTPHSGAPGRNISPLFPSLGQLKGEIRAGKRALPSPALKDASTPWLTERSSGLWSPSKAPNPSATSYGHHGNPALALRLVLNEDLAPNFISLD